MNTTKTRKPMSEGRKQLILLTKLVKLRMTAGTLPAGSVNEGLVALYKERGAADLRTMTQWNEAGMKVKKGSKSKAVWARPRNVKPGTVNEVPDAALASAETLEERYRFFPMAFLFDASDVEPMSEAMAAVVEKKLAQWGKTVTRVRALDMSAPMEFNS